MWFWALLLWYSGGSTQIGPRAQLAPPSSTQENRGPHGFEDCFSFYADANHTESTTSPTWPPLWRDTLPDWSSGAAAQSQPPQSSAKDVTSLALQYVPDFLQGYRHILWQVRGALAASCPGPAEVLGWWNSQSGQLLLASRTRCQDMVVQKTATKVAAPRQGKDQRQGQRKRTGAGNDTDDAGGCQPATAAGQAEPAPASDATHREANRSSSGLSGQTGPRKGPDGATGQRSGAAPSVERIGSPVPGSRHQIRGEAPSQSGGQPSGGQERTRQGEDVKVGIPALLEFLRGAGPDDAATAGHRARGRHGGLQGEGIAVGGGSTGVFGDARQALPGWRGDHLGERRDGTIGSQSGCCDRGRGQGQVGSGKGTVQQRSLAESDGASQSCRSRRAATRRPGQQPGAYTPPEVQRRRRTGAKFWQGPMNCLRELMGPVWAFAHSITLEHDFTAPFAARWEALQLEYELRFDTVGVAFTPDTSRRLEEAAETAQTIGPMWVSETGPLQQVNSPVGTAELTGLGSRTHWPHGDAPTPCMRRSAVRADDGCTARNSAVYHMPLQAFFHDDNRVSLNREKRHLNRIFGQCPHPFYGSESSGASQSQHVQSILGACTAPVLPTPSQRPTDDAFAPHATEPPFLEPGRATRETALAWWCSPSQRVQRNCGACTAVPAYGPSQSQRVQRNDGACTTPVPLFLSCDEALGADLPPQHAGSCHFSQSQRVQLNCGACTAPVHLFSMPAEPPWADSSPQTPRQQRVRLALGASTASSPAAALFCNLYRSDRDGDA